MAVNMEGNETVKIVRKKSFCEGLNNSHDSNNANNCDAFNTSIYYLLLAYDIFIYYLLFIANAPNILPYIFLHACL